MKVSTQYSFKLFIRHNLNTGQISFIFEIVLFMTIGVEKVVGWALSHHFMQCSEAPAKDAKLVLSSDRYVTTH